MKKVKTNVMRILDANNIEYAPHYYDPEITHGQKVAKVLDENPEQVFKTLVTTDGNHNYFVFMVPVEQELDLKKAAKVANVKKIELIPLKKLFPLVGYVHGGTSPIGMKKLFKTFIDETSLLFETIIFSGGKVGTQVEMNPNSLKDVIDVDYVDVVFYK